MPGKAKNPTKKLMIVESPSKIKSLKKILGEDFEIESSVGHIRDLPQPSELPAELKKGSLGKFAVNVENGFEPYYVVSPDKKKKVAELKKALAQADELYLATDRDREGEAIAWHLLEVLKPKVPVKRMVFGDITPESILQALENTRDVDKALVDAQETRRVLDRLYGYEVSPVLWRKVRSGISAGRVQSVATRLVVERERERMAFRSASYWDLSATFSPQGERPFSAKLTSIDGARVATGKDFTDRGELRPESRAHHLDEAGALKLARDLEGAPFAVTSVESKPYTRKPAAPFTTSTMQQEAARKLRLSSRNTMRVAQWLYENGYITYMRTDSPSLSDQATKAARAQARELYGSDSVPAKPRVYKSKSDVAQEAHEAIRPAGETFRTPAEVAGQLTPEQLKLYDLIWKRTVASQMADAKGSTATLRIGADTAAGRRAEFSVSGTVITFRGFLAAYEEGRDEQREVGDQQDATGTRLPDLAEGDRVPASDIAPERHDTTPPPRYSEASLIKALDELGIGRPSTITAIISVIMDRGYVYTRGTALVPSWLAFAVVRLLEEHFENLIDYDFSAAMEADLDRIAKGEENRVDWLSHFYLGTADDDSLTETRGLRNIVENLGDIDARDINSIPVTGDITLRVGRYGPYLEKVNPEGGDPLRAAIPEEVAPDELTPAKAQELMDRQPEGDRELGVDAATGRTVVVKDGRFGPYVTEVLPEPEETGAKKKASKEKPRTASLFRDMSVDTVSLEQALQLLSLPRTVGVDPADGKEITAQNGRYGPYLKKGTDSRTLEREEQLFSITLEEACAIYQQPKTRGARTAKPPLKELGADPATGKPMVVKDGRFGPYVTDGETNATLRKDDGIEGLTPERAAELLAEKRAKGPVKKKAPARKTTAKKAPAKKAPAKKTAAKKTADA